ncbi:hypothetical protein Syun_006671 [Stephania yunnanensis]|uniref:Uncharacterized protein n=1 Tax=Stephania yunnanensis TaxID=152371 RepID=A0AAP0PYQ7_9MAGN
MSSPNEDVGAPKRPSAGNTPGEVLQQTRNLRGCPVKIAMVGVALVTTIGYLTLYSKKKPEVTALEVAKVTAGITDDDTTRPRK